MAIPFILHSFPCSLLLSKVRISPKVTIACNGFCLLRHTTTWLARDIISLIQWYDVVAYTLLHREVRDYSLGQITFVFFERYLPSDCYHTAALSCKRVVNILCLLKDYYECLACIKSKQTRMIKNKNLKGK